MQFCVRRSYAVSMYFVALVIAGGGLYALGLRGFSHLSLLLILILPTFWLVLSVTMRIISTELMGGGFLHLTMDSEPHRLGRVPAFLFTNPGWTVESALLGLGALVFGGYMLWAAADGVLYLVMPYDPQIRNAGDGFAMRAEIHRDRLTFTNLSLVGWECDATIGDGLPLTFKASAALPPGQTREIRYVDFRPRYFLAEPVQLRASALRGVWVECKEPSGLFHRAVLK